MIPPIFSTPDAGNHGYILCTSIGLAARGHDLRCLRAQRNQCIEGAGRAKADVSLENKSAVVEFDPGKVQVEQFKRSVVEAGFEVAA